MAKAVRRSTRAWSPIGSAPKDGTQILCFTTNRDYEISHWNRIVQCWVSKRGFYVDASHWMPLPAAPSEPAVPAAASARAG